MAASAAMLAFADASFDFILCNNTLPYIREDRRALAEIARCLRCDGLAMIDTHRHPGTTRTAHAHRREHPGLGGDWFAANGDAWVYGEDFLDRVRDAGLEPVEKELFPGAPAEFFIANGLKPRSAPCSGHATGRAFAGSSVPARANVPASPRGPVRPRTCSHRFERPRQDPIRHHRNGRLRPSNETAPVPPCTPPRGKGRLPCAARVETGRDSAHGRFGASRATGTTHTTRGPGPDGSED